MTKTYFAFQNSSKLADSAGYQPVDLANKKLVDKLLTGAEQEATVKVIGKHASPPEFLLITGGTVWFCEDFTIVKSADFAANFEFCKRIEVNYGQGTAKYIGGTPKLSSKVSLDWVEFDRSEFVQIENTRLHLGISEMQRNSTTKVSNAADYEAKLKDIVYPIFRLTPVRLETSISMLDFFLWDNLLFLDRSVFETFIDGPSELIEPIKIETLVD